MIDILRLLRCAARITTSATYERKSEKDAGRAKHAKQQEGPRDKQESSRRARSGQGNKMHYAYYAYYDATLAPRFCAGKKSADRGW